MARVWLDAKTSPTAQPGASPVISGPRHAIHAKNINTTDAGPVKIPLGKIVGSRWRIVKKLGEGGCGAVYKVDDLSSKLGNSQAAMKAESNFVAGGTVLKLEVQILRRLASRPHMVQLLHSGKKEVYCYMVITLFGDSLSRITRKNSTRAATISTQIRVGINILYGIKQVHDIGFVHRDLKPSNIAIGRRGTADEHFLHVLDFGLSREYIVMEQGKPKMRRPRETAHFRGTVRYCSINTHEKGEQGRVDDLWSLLYLMAELRGPLPWYLFNDKKDVLEAKKHTELDILLENCPIEMVQIAQHLMTLNYYSRPDYLLIYNLLRQVMVNGKFLFMDPWDWTTRHPAYSQEKTQEPSKERLSKEMPASREMPMSAEAVLPFKVAATPMTTDDITYFPAAFFASNPLGF